LTDENRPNPDELLSRVKEAERRAARGRLTVFFGACPGVGKTYAMLQAARRERETGRDVVVGVVETHGRPETAALLEGIEQVPRRTVEHRGITLQEIDLDAVLSRKPALILVDELAHTNAGGSRHPKRWLDVEELLDAGIDVFTTLNVQHIESLGDTVAQLTGVLVRETVPDAMVERAVEIKLVDLPPDDLLQRLAEGKVYIPEQAGRAAEHFFRKGNLIGLRELTLRFVAERVDAQMQKWRAETGIERAWSASDRIMVCFSYSPHTPRVLRAAGRMARSLRAPLVAVYVERPSAGPLNDEDRAQLTKNFELAERMGAETLALSNDQPARAILQEAGRRNITKIVIGKPGLRTLKERLLGSFVDDIIKGSGEIDVFVTRGEAGELKPATPVPRARGWSTAGYVAALISATACTGLGFLIFGRDQLVDVAMLFLLGVVVVSLRFGLGPSIFAAGLGVAAFDVFFVPPYYTFVVADFRHVITFVTLFVVAVVTSLLTQRVRRQAVVARDRERRTATMYSMSSELARTTGRDAVLEIAARHLKEIFDCDVSVHMPDEAGELKRVFPRESAPGVPGENGVTRWVFKNAREAGPGTDTLQGAPGLHLPLVGSHGKVGVIGLFPKETERFKDPAHRRMLDALVTQTAASLERVELAARMTRERLRAEREQLRSTLLSSVSHDLRTPLAAITGAASTLLQSGGALSDAVRRELLETIDEEADRLNRLVRNLLDMTRLESGAVAAKKEWQPLEEVVGAALTRVEPLLAGREIATVIPADFPMVPLDTVLVEQVLVNILENALKYTPHDSPVSISARLDGGAAVVEVADRGPGVPPADLEKVFEKFYRSPRVGGVSGAGLGLAICRAIIAVHGGRMWAANREGGGAAFCFTLPIEGEPPTGADGVRSD
jgi:two-component system sensor histidine kinase KdpD